MTQKMKPEISAILRLFIVVPDAEAAAQAYEASGVGPWTFQDFSDAAVPEKYVRGEACAYQMKLATCDALNVGLGLIEPLDELSIFAEHLRDKGPGLHHVLVATHAGFEAALAAAGEPPNAVLQRGQTRDGIKYAHLDFTDSLGMILEAFDIPQ